MIWKTGSMTGIGSKIRNKVEKRRGGARPQAKRSDGKNMHGTGQEQTII